MTSTTHTRAAQEAARRDNGRFGVQSRDESGVEIGVTHGWLDERQRALVDELTATFSETNLARVERRTDDADEPYLSLTFAAGTHEGVMIDVTYRGSEIEARAVTSNPTDVSLRNLKAGPYGLDTDGADVSRLHAAEVAHMVAEVRGWVDARRRTLNEFDLEAYRLSTAGTRASVDRENGALVVERDGRRHSLEVLHEYGALAFVQIDADAHTPPVLAHDSDLGDGTFIWLGDDGSLAFDTGSDFPTPPHLVRQLEEQWRGATSSLVTLRELLERTRVRER